MSTVDQPLSEDQTTEWKSSWHDDYLKWVCGFANAQGGVLEIGRNDKGQVVGLGDAARLMEELPNKVRDLLGIMVEVNLRTVQGKDCVQIAVEAYPNPISYKGEYYCRSGSTNQALRGAALDRFLLRKHGRTWDGVPMPGVALEDLDAEGFVRFRQRAARSQRLGDVALVEDDAALIEKLRLVEGQYLKRAAILLFHPDPARFFIGAAVRIGYFASESDLRYHDEVEGDLFTQVSKTMDLLLTKYLKATISYDGIQRVESYPVPEVALREALLNAIVHRDYAVAAPIQIRVHADRLRIWNPGELPDNWTEADLLGSHPSQPYNPDVANVFFRAGEIETWGRGIQRVLDACRAANSPEPQIRVEPRDVWFEFPFSASYLTSVSGAVERTAPVETPVKTPVKTRVRILRLLTARPDMTLAEVAANIGKSLSAVERASAKLTKEGRLRYVGPRKGGHWEVIGETDA